MKDLLNRIQLRHLRLIHAVNEGGQLSNAADRLAITRPAAPRKLAKSNQLSVTAFPAQPQGHDRDTDWRGVSDRLKGIGAGWFGDRGSDG